MIAPFNEHWGCLHVRPAKYLLFATNTKQLLVFGVTCALRCIAQIASYFHCSTLLLTDCLICISVNHRNQLVIPKRSVDTNG